MNPRTFNHSSESSQISREPGFLTIALTKAWQKNMPLKKSGLLAFLHVSRKSETVTKFIMCDDIAKSCRENLPFSGGANSIAFFVFKDTDRADFDGWKAELRHRLQHYAQLTEKYRVPQRGCEYI